MMKHFFLLSFILLFVQCTDDDVNVLSNSNSGGKEIQKPNNVINSRLFDVINLDYPGLESAKQLYEEDKHYDAAKAILEYYRNRIDVVNPSISLINVSVSNDDRAKADYALDDYRFFVNNYYEDDNEKKPYSLLKDGSIDWTFKPSGADDEYQKQLHRHQWFVSQAKVYRASRDEKYIKSWIDVYKNWLDNNPMPESGTNNTSWWQLQVATRVSDQVQLFDYYKYSTNFTPEWFSQFLSNFADHADFLIKYPYPEGGNILISQANALAFAGVLFPELKNAETWKNTGYNILNEAVENQFLADGMHYELDFSYHISTIADYYETMKLAEANPSITGSISADFTKSLHKAAQIVMHFTYPGIFNSKQSGYLVPGFNDTRQDSWTKSVLTRNFNRYVEMFPDDKEMLYMATAGKQGSAPSVAPKAFDTSGYYMLRNGWTQSSTMFILSNNYSEEPVKSWSHNQADNGTFELYHNGRNFFPDTGVFTYYTQGGDNTQRNWYRQTKVHNTMTLDGKNITSTLGKSLKVESQGTTDVLVTENQGYANMKHRRYVFFVDKKFFVLVDEGAGDAAGTVNLNFHLCQGSDTEVVVDNESFGAHTAFSDGNNIIVRSFANGELTTVPFAGKVSYKPQEEFDRKSYSLDFAKTADNTARYITVIYPKADAAKTVINASFKDSGYNESGVKVEVSIDGDIYDLNCNL